MAREVRMEDIKALTSCYNILYCFYLMDNKVISLKVNSVGSSAGVLLDYDGTREWIAARLIESAQ